MMRRLLVSMVPLGLLLACSDDGPQEADGADGSDDSVITDTDDEVGDADQGSSESGESDSSEGESDSGESESDTSESDADADASADADADASADTGTETADTETDSSDTEDIVCTKVDVVFAVDNSGSMQQEINALQGPVFESLPESLLEVGNGIEDFNLGVINGCPKPGYLFDEGDDGPCGYSTGANYMSSDSPDLDGEYACVMTMNDDGYMGMAQLCEDSGNLGDDDEQPASAAAAVLSPDNVMGNNAGFLRDDALLFVVAMTDEDEELIDAQGNDVDPQTIVDQIVAAKGTIDNVVMLGIGGASDCNGPYGSADDAQNLQAITQAFIDADRGLYWDLCDGDLETAFDQALVIVDEACFEIVPQ